MPIASSHTSSASSSIAHQDSDSPSLRSQPDASAFSEKTPTTNPDLASKEHALDELAKLEDENLSHSVCTAPVSAPHDASQKSKSDTTPDSILANLDEFDIDHKRIDPSKFDEREKKIYDVQKSILEFEIKHQRGIEIYDQQITVPGRLSITLCSLLETLAITLGLATSFIHFAIYSPNYLLAVFVIAVVLFFNVILYDSSYRTQRIALSVLQLLATLIFIALVDWAFVDICLNPQLASQRKFFLIAATLSLNFVPLLMTLHVLYLGRGRRTIRIKKKTTPTIQTAAIPTKIVKIPENHASNDS